MENYLKVSITIALIVLVNSMPQGTDVERAPPVVVVTVKPAVVIVRPSRQPPAGIAALQATYDALGNIASSAGNLVSSSLDSMANRAYNVAKTAAESTGQFIDNTAQATANGINSVANTLSSTIKRPFREDPVIAESPTSTHDIREHEVFIEI